MILAGLAAISMGFAIAPIQQSQYQSGRYEMAERLKMVDVAWLQSTELSKKTEAIDALKLATNAFFGLKYAQASQKLDSAAANLIGRAQSSADAISARFLPPVVEPGSKAKLSLTWAYEPEDPQPIDIKVGDQKITLVPGVPQEILIDAPLSSGNSAEGAVAKEYGVLVPIMIGERSRSAYLSVINQFQTRLTPLLESPVDAVRALAKQISDVIAEPANQEIDVPVLQNLTLAEDMQEKRKSLWQVGQFPIVYHKNAWFRAAFPSQTLVNPDLAEPVTVVMAFHGAGGSENMFFESYGHGIAMTEALKRGWVFVAPRSPVDPNLVYDWLVNVRKLKIKRVFAIGHSFGAGSAMQCATLPVRSSGTALFAPAASNFPVEWANQPLYFAVGKQDLGAVVRVTRNLSLIWKERKDIKFEEFANCEHLMIVSDAVRNAYSYLESSAR